MICRKINKILSGNITSSTSQVETNCIIQDHRISDCSQICSGCSFRCTCLLQVAHLFGHIFLQHVCCCLDPFYMTRVEYYRLLHEIQGSVNVLCFSDPHSYSDADLQLSIDLLPQTPRSLNISSVPRRTTMCRGVDSPPYAHLTCPLPSQWPRS